MSTKKIAMIVGTSAATLALFASLAMAETTTSDTGDHPLTITPAVKMMVNINASGHAQLSGTIAAVQSNSITVNSWGGVWTANITSDTKLTRRFGGNATISEFAAGDLVMVMGMAHDGSSWTIDAKKIQDMSIQARNASFSGTISGLQGSNFNLATKNRGTVKVTVNSDAKVMVNGKMGSVTDLANDMKASVSGVWDRTQTTVMASKVSARTPETKSTENTGNEH
jgi:hypothetical protein